MEPGQQYSEEMALCAMATWSGEKIVSHILVASEIHYRSHNNNYTLCSTMYGDKIFVC